MVYDKRAAANIIGCLIKQPELLVNTDKYLLEKTDFDNRLHRIVFSTIYNLFHSGAEKISINDIHTYLKKYPELYNTFNEQKGSEFVVACEETAEVGNFDFYYDRIKKLALLRRIKEEGYSIKEWFVEDGYDISKRQELEKKLEDATLQEILISFQGKLFQIESEFVNKKNFHYGVANEGLEDLIDQLKEVPEIGFPLQGELFTTVSRGARKGKLYLMSARTGVGKSRAAVGHASFLAFPVRWCRKTDKWINEGSNQKVLFITTELSFDEIQTMILSNISGINEEKILNGKYSFEEQKRLAQTLQIIDRYKENFHLYHMPDPSIEQLNSNIRRLVIGKQIDAVFFDYIHTSPNLLAEFSGAKIREDVALSLMSTALKNLANELGVFVWSGTQLNASSIDIDFADESTIRSSRSIIDKADFACVLQMADNEKLKTISNILQNGTVRPNMYLDIFKNRRAKYKRVRLWLDVDLGCSKFTDLFLTDEHGNEIPIDLLYTIDKSAKCDITEIFLQTAENEQPTSQKFSSNNITL